MSLCLASAGIVKSLSVAAFVMSWTHPVEKTEWREDWRITPQGFEIVEARISGSGAGMEPPTGARLVDGWMRWKPQLPRLTDVVFHSTGAAGEWRLCVEGQCRDLWAILGQPPSNAVIRMSPCKGPQPLPEAFDANGLLARGIAFREKGDRRRALADFDAALRIDPQHEATRAARKSLFQEIERLGATMPLKLKDAAK